MTESVFVQARNLIKAEKKEPETKQPTAVERLVNLLQAGLDKILIASSPNTREFRVGFEVFFENAHKVEFRFLALEHKKYPSGLETYSCELRLTPVVSMNPDHSVQGKLSNMLRPAVETMLERVDELYRCSTCQMLIKLQSEGECINCVLHKAVTEKASKDQKFDCVICKQERLKQVQHKLPCKHDCFCDDCIENLERDFCPLCRAPFGEELERQEVLAVPDTVPVPSVPIDMAQSEVQLPFVPPRPLGPLIHLSQLGSREQSRSGLFNLGNILREAIHQGAQQIPSPTHAPETAQALISAVQEHNALNSISIHSASQEPVVRSATLQDFLEVVREEHASN